MAVERVAAGAGSHERLPLVGVRRAFVSFVTEPRNVVVVGLTMIGLQLAYRTWALLGGWFLIDDYAFLADQATKDTLTLNYLFHTHNDHLQPLGFFIAWIVGSSPTPYDWTLASIITLSLQALASLAAFAFLLRLAGRRWSVLVPLGFYLFSVITVPGFMWWCVAVMQVPQQLAAFAAMTFHVQYIRTRRLRYVILTALALAFGMICDVKVAFVGAGLAFLSLYLSDARGWRPRLFDAVVRQWKAWAVYGALFLSYLALYLSLASIGGRETTDRLPIFEVMFRYTLGPTLVGGPWRWGEMGDTPLVPAAPPEWAVTLTWVALAGLLLLAWRRRRAALWVLVPTMACVVVNVFMVATARGSSFGYLLGYEVRYLGDLAPTLTLAIAVLATGLAPRRTVEAPARATVVPSPPVLLVGAVAVVIALGGSLVSTTEFVRNWHSDYPVRVFVQNVVRQSESTTLRVVDDRLPLGVVPGDAIVRDYGSPSGLFPPLGGRVVTSLAGTDLGMFDGLGNVVPAKVVAKRDSGQGPVTGCGFKVTSERRIPLASTGDVQPVGDVWWGTVAYLASGRGTGTIALGSTVIDVPIESGLHTFVFLGAGEPDEATVRVDDGMTMCIDRVQVGNIATSEQASIP
jgi:hypothetical protein